MNNAQQTFIQVVNQKFAKMSSVRITPSAMHRLKRIFDDCADSNDLMPPDIAAHFQDLIDEKIDDTEMWMLDLLQMVHRFLLKETGGLNHQIHQSIMEQYICVNAGLLNCGLGLGNIDKSLVEAYVSYIMQRASAMNVGRGIFHVIQRVQNEIDICSMAEIQQAKIAHLVEKLKLDPQNQSHLIFWSDRTSPGIFHHGGVTIPYANTTFRVPAGIGRMMAETDRHGGYEQLLTAYYQARDNKPFKSIFTGWVRHRDTKAVYQAEDLTRARLSF